MTTQNNDYNNIQHDYISPRPKLTPIEREWLQLWENIEKAGGRYQYVQQQLVNQGFVVERQPIDDMSPKERERYKKTLKKEALEAQKLKKATWQAYKANHIVYLGSDIYWSDDTSADKWDIQDAHNRLIENHIPILTKPKELADALNLNLRQLKGLTFHRDVATNVPYTHFTIAKRSGKPRDIWAPVPRLKYVQRWILDNILNNLMVHGLAHGFIRGKSIVTNASEHVNSELLIKLDITDFFPSVHWRRVKGVFRHAGYHEQIATLLAMLCTESPRQLVKHNGMTHYVALGDRCLPQGAPTSPALSNIVCLNLDRRLTGLADKLGLRYSRYADDLTFSLSQLPQSTDNQLDNQSKSQKHLQTAIKSAKKTGKQTSEPSAKTTDQALQDQLIGQLLGSVAKILQEEGFALNSDKTKIIRTGNQQTVTGMVVNGNAPPRVPRHIKRMLKAAVYNLQQGKPLREGETYDTLVGYASWIASAEPELGFKYLKLIADLQGNKN